MKEYILGPFEILTLEEMLAFVKRDLHSHIEESNHFSILNEIKNLFENKIVSKAKNRIQRELHKLDQKFNEENKLRDSLSDDEIFSQAENSISKKYTTDYLKEIFKIYRYLIQIETNLGRAEEKTMVANIRNDIK